MEQSQLEALQRWFDGYVRSYGDMNADDHRNIELKIEHTRQVCQAMGLLATGERLSPEKARLAAAVALLHDVGRFMQYRCWRTFRDSDSANHARLSIEVIRQEGLLRDLPADERLQIEEAVRFHNLLNLPLKHRSPDTLFIRLIRDADKLDIWRVFLDYFHKPPEERASAAGLGFADLPEVTPACVAALAAGEVVRLEQARTLNDFKLLQISWAFDLNFPTSYRLLSDRRYIEQLAATLPSAPEVQKAVERALEQVRHKAAQRP